MVLIESVDELSGIDDDGKGDGDESEHGEKSKDPDHGEAPPSILNKKSRTLRTYPASSFKFKLISTSKATRTIVKRTRITNGMDTSSVLRCSSGQCVSITINLSFLYWDWIQAVRSF